MKESRLTPFDAELLVMIGDIAKSKPDVEENPDRYEIMVDTTEIQGKSIEALKQAVAGRLTTRPEREFNREFEPKGVSVPKEPGDNGCGNCAGQSKPEKICGTCRYFNPEFPVKGNPVPVCLALKMIKGGTEFTDPRGTQPHFRCSCGKYERRY